MKTGETTADNKLSLLTVRCPGACGMAPVVMLDGAVKGHVTVYSLRAQVKGWLRGSAGTT